MSNPCNAKLALIVCLVTALSKPVFAQVESTAVDSLRQRIEELEQKQRILERKLEIEKEEAAAKAKTVPVVIAGKEGFSLKSGDGSYLLRLRAHGQADGRFFLGDQADTGVDQFLSRRQRFLFEGTVAKIFDFKFMPDFAGSKVVLQDFFIDARLSPKLKIKVGKFKTPFGIERLQSPTNLLFIERGLPNNLVPNRDFGVQLHGDVLGGALNYMVGVFNGVLDGNSGDGDAYDDKDLAMRLMLSPFIKTAQATALQGLSLGIAATGGIHRGTAAAPNTPTYNTPGQQTLFRYRSDGTAAGTTIINGTVERLSPQAYYHWGRLGILSEYVQAIHHVVRGDAAAALQHRAYQIVGSFSLTGEPAAYKGMTPAKDFDLQARSWGGLELVARYGVVATDRDAFPLFADPSKYAHGVQAWAIGLNWYLNRNVKFVVNYERSTFQGGAADGDRPEEQALFTRVQVGF